MRFTIERKMLAGFAVVAALIFLSSDMMRQVGNRRAELGALIAHSRAVQTSIAELRVDVAELDAQERGGVLNVLAGKRALPLTETISQIDREMHGLAWLMKDNETEQAILHRLDTAIAERVAATRAMFAFYQEHPSAGLSLYIQTHSQSNVATIQEALGALQREEGRMLGQDVSADKSYVIWADRMLLTSRLLIFVSLLLVYLGVRHANRERQVAYQRVNWTLESITDCFFALDSNWRFTYMNVHAQRHFETREHKDVLGHSIWEMFPVLVGTEFEHRYRRVMETQQTEEFEEYYPTLGGWFAVRAYPAGEGITVYFRETTNERQADERFRVLFEESSDAHLLFDETGIVDCNHATLAMLNCQDKAQLLHLHPAVLSPDRQPDGCRSDEKCLEMDALAHQKGCHRFEWLHRKVTGEEFPVEVTLTPVKLQGSSVILTVWHDLTERKEAEKALRQSEERFAIAVQGSSDGLWDWDLRQQTIYFSPRWKAMLGYTDDEIANRIDVWLDLLHPDDMPDVWHDLNEYLEGRFSEYDTEFRMRCKDGSYRWVRSRGAALRDADGKPYRIAGSHTDVTERRGMDAQIRRQMSEIRDAKEELEQQQAALLDTNARLEEAVEQLEMLATTDGLTGLKNHRAFQERLAQLHRQAHRSHLPLSLLLLDVDKFKQFNDTFGHPAGDVVLKRVAQVLHDTARVSDLPARYGGEEFALLLPDTDEEGALQMAERLRQAIEGQPWAQRAVTASIGVATLTPHGDGHNGLLTLEPPTPATLIQQADQALYASKAQGRNRCTHHETLAPEVTEKAA